ncbi:hypothetical protein THTE_3131 [Thermogutta terrifontis]|uniref:Uncharacterized protein n=1 Tax=Thermogutta terrifontis TaxID=1331910 RepID=A0A286RIE8_9BACT|nr:hypothetical protein THTE_3131 [Thermogutta terrifontis]
MSSHRFLQKWGWISLPRSNGQFCPVSPQDHLRARPGN